MRVAGALLLVLVATACGARESDGDGSQSRSAAAGKRVAAADPWGPRDCEEVGSLGGKTYRLCSKRRQNEHGTFEVLDGKSRSVIPNALPPAPPPGTPLIGHWHWAALSPDGHTLLAQWSAECEIPQAYFLRVSGGRARGIGPVDRLGSRPSSVALGWTTDGRAIVEFPELACGGSDPGPGVYLVSLDGKRTYWRPLGSVRPSKRPRPAGGA